MPETVLTTSDRRVDLTPAERSERTRELFRQIEGSEDEGDRESLRKQVAELNLGVVRGLASRYRGRGEAIEDLEQAGCVGLMKAVKGFHADRGTEFITYAIPTIAGELKKHFRDHCWTVRPTRRLQELQAELASATASMSQTLGRAPSLAELSDELGEDADVLGEAIAAHGCYSPRSLDAPLRSFDHSLGAALRRDEGGFAQAEAHVVLEGAIRTLSAQDREILGLRFYRDLTQRQIAAEIGTTQMQVSRVLTRIMARLREEIAATGIG